MVKGLPQMRNAVIRKKVIKEQADFPRSFLYPQRLIVPASEQVEWTEANERVMRIWAVTP